MNRALEGKTALITGGTSGIGLATAKLFVREGARVTVTGNHAERAAQADRELEGKARVQVSDACRENDVRELVADVVERHHAIDVLFLNAGLPLLAPIATMNEAVFDSMINVNLKAPWFALRAAIPHLSQGSSVILTTSVANVSGAEGLSAYAAAKAGLRALARCAARELLSAGIRVNAISPGPIDTPIVTKMGLPAEQQNHVREYLRSQVPMGRMGTPEEVARAVLFLASDASSFVTGTELVVDGGATQL